jgi:malate/lactate dehydrogenase
MPCVTIAILGAGDIGTATARQLAAADIATEIVLVDDATTVAQGKALDVRQAAPVDRYDTQVRGSSDESVLVRASVVIVADRAQGGEWTDEAGLALVQRVARYATRAPILCAGVRQRIVIDRGVHELGLSRTRLFGTAPEALRGAVVSLVALAAEAGPAEISLLVVGRPPRDIIVPWSTASIGGRAATDVLPPPAVTHLDDALPRLWPPGPHTLGSAAASVVRTLVMRGSRTHVLEVVPDPTLGGGSPAMLPARVGPGGVVSVEAPPLPPRDRVRLETALAQ